MSDFLCSVTFLLLLCLCVCRLEKERARVKAQAYADSQAHVQEEVSRILASERAAALDRVTAEEERLRTKLLVSS